MVFLQMHIKLLTKEIYIWDKIHCLFVALTVEWWSSKFTANFWEAYAWWKCTLFVCQTPSFLQIHVSCIKTIVLFFLHCSLQADSSWWSYQLVHHNYCPESHVGLWELCSKFLSLFYSEFLWISLKISSLCSILFFYPYDSIIIFYLQLNY